MAKYNERNEQVPDDRPVAVPLGFKKPLGIQELIRRYVRAGLEEGQEGEESAADLTDIESDEEDMELSQYQRAYMVDEEFSRIAESKVLAKRRKKAQDAPTPDVKADIKEKADVQDSSVGVDRKGAGADGKVGAASGGKGRTAGDGGE